MKTKIFEEMSDDEKAWVQMITKTSEEILMEKVVSIANEIHKKTLNGLNWVQVFPIDDTDLDVIPLKDQTKKYRNIDDDWVVSMNAQNQDF